MPTIRTEAYDISHNEKVLARDLNLVDQRRENALAKTYNQKVQYKQFSVGDLVMRKVIENTKAPVDGKLAPNWDDPTRYFSSPVRVLINSKIPRANKLQELRIPTT